MELYISNDTRQNHMFQVRWHGDTSGRLFSRMIASGSQIKLTERDIGDSALTRWQDIREHLERMGARDAAELHRSQIEDFKGISYRWDAPISEDEIRMGHDMVLDNADRISAEEALKAAQGFDLSINGNGSRKARATGVEVIEDADPRQGPRTDAVQFAVSVDPDAQGKAGRLKRRN